MRTGVGVEVIVSLLVICGGLFALNKAEETILVVNVAGLNPQPK